MVIGNRIVDSYWIRIYQRCYDFARCRGNGLDLNNRLLHLSIRFKALIYGVIAFLWIESKDINHTILIYSNNMITISYAKRLFPPSSKIETIVIYRYFASIKYSICAYHFSRFIYYRKEDHQACRWFIYRTTVGIWNNQMNVD
jgi:hypothetical protein